MLIFILIFNLVIAMGWFRHRTLTIQCPGDGESKAKAKDDDDEIVKRFAIMVLDLLWFTDSEHVVIRGRPHRRRSKPNSEQLPITSS